MRNVVIAAGMDGHTLLRAVAPGSPVIRFNFEATWQGRIARKAELLLGPEIFRCKAENFIAETADLVARWIFHEMGDLDEYRIKAILINPENQQVRANFVCTVLQAYLNYHKEVDAFTPPPRHYAA